MAAKLIPRHCQMSAQGQNHPWLRTPTEFVHFASSVILYWTKCCTSLNLVLRFINIGVVSIIILLLQTTLLKSILSFVHAITAFSCSKTFLWCQMLITPSGRWVCDTLMWPWFDWTVVSHSQSHFRFPTFAFPFCIVLNQILGIISFLDISEDSYKNQENKSSNQA